MEIINLDDLRSLHLNILPYGEPGVGKTYFVGSVGECLYTLAIDVDNGFKTIKLVPKKWRDNLVTVKMTSFDDVDLVYQMILKNDPEEMTKKFGVPITKPFEAVAFDTWTQLGWDSLQEKRKELKKFGDPITGKTKLDFRKNIEIQDWGQLLDFHQLCIDAFTDLPVTFVCTMHEMYYTDKKTDVTRGVPSINGKFAPEIGKYFDVVGHMYIDPSGKYAMATKAHQRFQAKTRLKLDALIFEPTFKKLYDTILKERQ